MPQFAAQAPRARSGNQKRKGYGQTREIPDA